MSGPIQQPPWGYLHTLNMKTTGRNPAMAQDEVQPAVDMLPFYLSGHLASASNTGNVAAVGNSVLISPPPGIGWIPVHAQYGVTTVAGDQVACSLMVRSSPNSRFRIDSFPMQTAVAAAVSTVKGFAFPMQWLILPGVGLEMIVDDQALGAARVGSIAAHFFEIEL